jgi:hypothetical protein
VFLRNLRAIRTLIGCPCKNFPGPVPLGLDNPSISHLETSIPSPAVRADARTSFSKPLGTSRQVRTLYFFHFHLLSMYTTFSIGTSCMVKNNEYAVPPHLGPSTPTFRCTCCARRHRSLSSTSVRERLASANALAISGKRCEPGFPDAEPFYTYTAPPRIFFGLTILKFSSVPR